MNTPEAALGLGGTEWMPPRFSKQSLQLLFGAKTLSLLFEGKGG